MTCVFAPTISVPPADGDAAPDDSAFTPDQRAFAEQLRLRYGEHAAALEAGDVDAIMAFFADDAVWLGAGWPSRNGQRELRALFEEVAGTARVHCRSLHAFVKGGSGWNFVDYRVAPKDASVAPWTFRTSFQWTRKDGHWLCNGVLCFTA